MKTVFRILFAYPWLLFIVVTCANAAIWWKRGESARRENPQLEESYRQLIQGFVFWANLPWLVMGASMLMGATTISSYIGPDANLRNPHVAAWFGVVVVLWVLGTNWLVIRDGAEQLVRHPGLLNYRNVSARSIKVRWLLGLGGGVLALVVLFARTGGRP